jgi:hypothetical protein
VLLKSKRHRGGTYMDSIMVANLKLLPCLRVCYLYEKDFTPADYGLDRTEAVPCCTNSD